jgi:hypothetical protein
MKERILLTARQGDQPKSLYHKGHDKVHSGDLEVSIGKVSKEPRDAFFEHHHFVFYSRSQGGALK